jgi:hypothetical protein
MARACESDVQVSMSGRKLGDGFITFGPVPPVLKDLVLKDILPPPPLLVNSKVVKLFRGSGSRSSL